MLVIIGNPGFQSLDQRKGAGPVPEPQTCFLQGAHDPLSVRVSLRVVSAGAHVVNSQGSAGPQKPRRRGLAAVITHQRETLGSDPGRELPMDGHVQGREPILRLALPASRIADHDLGVPIEPHHHVDPAEALDQHLGHVDAPPLVGLRGSRCAPPRRPLGLQLQVRGDPEVVLPHPSPHPLVGDRLLRNARPVSPDTAIAPERVLGLELPDPLEEDRVPLGPQGRWGPAQPHTSSLLLSSSVKSPTRVFSRAFAGVRRAAR